MHILQLKHTSIKVSVLNIFQNITERQKVVSVCKRKQKIISHMGFGMLIMTEFIFFGYTITFYLTIQTFSRKSENCMKKKSQFFSLYNLLLLKHLLKRTKLKIYYIPPKLMFVLT